MPVKYNLIERVLKLFNEENLLNNPSLLLMLSGGMDSSVMLEVITRIFSSTKQIFALHINYQLRNKESNLEEKLVKKICQQKKITLFSYRENIPHNQNIQSATRILRYQKAQELLKKNKIDYLLSGHHADDVIETFFAKLIKGQSLTSLASFSSFKKGYLLRPLIYSSKKNILDFAHQEKIPFLEDSSNLLDHYERNYIRNKVFPLLNKKFSHSSQSSPKNHMPHYMPYSIPYSMPYWKKNILQVQEYIQTNNQLIEILIAEQSLVTQHYCFEENLFFFISKKLLSLKLDFKKVILHYFFNLYFPKKRFSQGEIIEILNKIDDGKNSKELFQHELYGKVYYSRGWIAPELLIDKVILYLNKTENLKIYPGWEWTLEAKLENKNVAQKKSSKYNFVIQLSIPLLKPLKTNSLTLVSFKNYQQQKNAKINLKKFFEDKKYPLPLRQSIILVLEENHLIGYFDWLSLSDYGEYSLKTFTNKEEEKKTYPYIINFIKK